MSNAPLYERLKAFSDKNPARFFMPGHKGKKIKDCYLSPVFPYDVTELFDTGCLYEEDNIIDQSHALLARAYGVGQAFFLTGGSTQGNFCSLRLATAKGNKKVLMDRNVHKSALHAAILLDLDIAFIQGGIMDEFHLALPPDVQAVKEALKRNKPAALFLTSPTYFGLCADVEGISRACREHGVSLIIDGAHGAHFAFSSLMPAPVQKYADFCTLSAHKTLPALTQGAYFCVNAKVKKEEVLEAMSFSGTSSPSYLIMASLDYARAYMERYGEEKIAKIVELNQNITKSIKKSGRFLPLEEEICQKYHVGFDQTKLVVHTDGCMGENLYRALYQENILLEMADEENVLAMPSLLCEKDDYERLEKALLAIQIKGRAKKETILGEIIPQRVLPLKEAYFRPSESVDVSQSKGRIVSGIVSKFPPGTVILAPGEKIEKEVYDALCQNFSGAIRVIKED